MSAAVDYRHASVPVLLLSTQKRPRKFLVANPTNELSFTTIMPDHAENVSGPLDVAE
jgi:hypothetical protein